TVRHLLGIPLHYLQTDAHRTRAVTAVLAEKRCGRELDWQSHTLTCARFARTQLRMLAGVVYSWVILIAVVPVYWILMSLAACIVHPCPTGWGHTNAVFRKLACGKRFQDFRTCRSETKTV